MSRTAGVYRVECKNLRSGEVYRRLTPAWKVELQRTRNSKDGSPTRGYRFDEFEILAVCLFNQTGKWEFRFVKVAALERREGNLSFLKVFQRVPFEVVDPWRCDIMTVIEEIEGA